MLSDLKVKYTEIMQNLEKDLKNKEDLEYVKDKINSVFIMFMDEIEAITDKYEERIDHIVEQQAYLDKKMKQVEKTISTIEKDIYAEDEEYDFQIVCPYCNNEFIMDFDEELNKEVKCPECDNIIELDWNEEDENGCSGNCSGCGHECGEGHEDLEDDDM
ncbi:MAG: hypothetical protein IKT41_00455 [Clostridia bacterium]|nr:hypothetical protein [Clostridia bacterium]